jgi:hypothetical protein
MTQRIDNIFWNFLALVLLGYAVIGRGVAYIGVSPIFVGEIALLLGIIAVCSSRRRLQLPLSPALFVLGLFMIWCAARMVPFIGKWQINALRDSAIWIYGLYGFVIASLVVNDPGRLVQILQRYRTFAWAVVIVAPGVLLIDKVSGGAFPKLPGSDASIIQLKGGDVCVHLTAVFAYLTLFTPVAYATPLVLLIPATLALNMLVRAGLVTFALGATVLTLFRPRNPLLFRLALVCVMGVGVMWAFNIRVQPDPTNPRQISTDQLINNFMSMFSSTKSEALDGSKEWRMKWWSAIIQYTFHGPYFWTGKGFGVNLANDDGFQVEEEELLRSPHNGHLTILARAGVPGFTLWVLLQMTWVLGILASYVRTVRRGDRRWGGVFIFLLVYWLAFMTNAAFDVYLEGPMGGIWYWSMFGVGVGAVKVYQRNPRVLDQYENPSGAQLLSAGRWRGRGVRVGASPARTARA